MKRILALLMFIFFVFIFSSCGSSEPAVVGSDDTTAKGTAIVENTTNNMEDNQGTEENALTDIGITDKTKEEATSQNPKPDKVIIEDDEIITPAFKLEIPEDFVLKADGEDPLLENKKGTVQFNIMDKTDSVTDFEKYVSDTYNSAAVVGMAKGEIEKVNLASVEMRRFAMIMNDDDGEELDSYVYLAQVNGRVLLITLTSKDGTLADTSQADAFVESIEF